MTNLKPCPFCKVEDSLFHYAERDGKEFIAHTHNSCVLASRTFLFGPELIKKFNTRPIEDELRTEKEKFRRMWIDDTVTLQDKLEKTKEATKQFIKNAREGQYESMINSYSMPANDLVDFERALKDIEETTNV